MRPDQMIVAHMLTVCVVIRGTSVPLIGARFNATHHAALPTGLMSMLTYALLSIVPPSSDDSILAPGIEIAVTPYRWPIGWPAARIFITNDNEFAAGNARLGCGGVVAGVLICIHGLDHQAALLSGITCGIAAESRPRLVLSKRHHDLAFLTLTTASLGKMAIRDRIALHMNDSSTTAFGDRNDILPDRSIIREHTHHKKDTHFSRVANYSGTPPHRL